MVDWFRFKQWSVLAMFAMVIVVVLYRTNIYKQSSDEQQLENVDSSSTPPQEDVSDNGYDPLGIAPCGEVCTYEGEVTNPTAKPYPQIHKNINCDNIMKRMAFTNHKIVDPAPEVPPSHLLKAYTMDGATPITRFTYYMEKSFATVERRFTKENVDALVKKTKDGISVNVYNDEGCAMHYVGNSSQLIKGHGVVIGSMSPWLESILLANGADRLTTLEYANIHFDHPQLATDTPYTFAEKYTHGEPQQFDFAASFSSLEHSGIGRYTDPLNPYGDLEAMAQIWCMLKPGGIFILGLPGSVKHAGMVFWNANRYYGSVRMPQMIANYEYVDRLQCPHFDHFMHTIRKIQ